MMITKFKNHSEVPTSLVDNILTISGETNIKQVPLKDINGFVEMMEGVDNGTKKTIHFGQAGAPDYTITKDKSQRKRYLDRHRKRENWNKPESAGALSRWILWGPSTSRRENIQSFKKRFGYVNR